MTKDLLSKTDKLRLGADNEKTYMLALVDLILRKYGMDKIADTIKKERVFRNTGDHS